ncbi:MAG: pilus assembly protein [Rhodospirillaceae bacterium]|jgi:Flp pilus assembly protein TadG|nr:pilus assembly protein [Rhodospirillaceae bacterium]MBT7953952.1 pilus assembly protein [Rhodospirillaceae bacterium]
MVKLKKNISDSNEGSVAIEFGFGVIPLALLIVGILEIGMILFASTLMEGSLREASRYGITGQIVDENERLNKIIEIVSQKTIGLIDPATAQIEVLVYPAFGDIGNGESFIDGNANGIFDAGETFTDSNDNGTWDADMGVAGSGGPGAVVLYRLTYNWPLLTPLIGNLISENGTIPLQASIVVRNEPWDEEEGA